jgi:hypothetical protein
VLPTLGVSALLDFSVPGVEVAAGALAGDAEGGVPSAVDAGGTLGSPAAALGVVAAVLEGALSAGAVVTAGLGGVSILVSLVQAVSDVPTARAPTVARNLRVNIICSVARETRAS